MRVLVSEFLVGGASSGTTTSDSMRREGMAMLKAIVEDIALLPGCSVVTTLESRHLCPLPGEVIPVEDAEHESVVFRQLLGKVGAALVIAPETDGVLADRCRQVIDAGIDSWNCSPAAIELCGDKLRLAQHLADFGLPTIPAKMADLASMPTDAPWPLVLKPRDGAGSTLTFLVGNRLEWQSAAKSFHDADEEQNCLSQPFIAGRSLSIGVNVSFDGKRVECLEIGDQRLSDDRRFRYLGGAIPADIPSGRADAIKELARAACRTIPGLAGYIGIDLLLTNQGQPLIVEINPRLTTAYVGYRRLYTNNLPSRWFSSASEVPLEPKTRQPVEFDISQAVQSAMKMPESPRQNCNL